MTILNKYFFANIKNYSIAKDFAEKENSLFNLKASRENQIAKVYQCYINSGYSPEHAFKSSQMGDGCGNLTIGLDKKYMFSRKYNFEKGEGPYKPNVMEVKFDKNCDIIVSTTDILDKERMLIQAKFKYDPTPKALGSMLDKNGTPYNLMGDGEKTVNFFKQTGLVPTTLRFSIGKILYQADETNLDDFSRPQTTTLFCYGTSESKDLEQWQIDHVSDLAGTQVLDIIGQNLNGFKEHINVARHCHNLEPINFLLLEKQLQDYSGPAEVIPGDDELEQ